MMASIPKNTYTESSIMDYPGRASDSKYYLRELIKFKSIEQIEYAESNLEIGILGYACDEGVIRNLGRPGAVDGPDSIRKKIAGLANHFSNLGITDFGSVFCVKKQLEMAQHQFSEYAYELLHRNYFPIFFGGGHDIVLPHFQAVRRFVGSDQRIGVINFDAHLDLRIPQAGEGTSGTPFYQIAQLVPDQFHYLPIGIQRQSNHIGLFQTAQSLGVKAIELKDCTWDQLDSIKSSILNWMSGVDAILVTIDLDGFSSAFSPGVSAPNPIGLSPDFVTHLLKFIFQSNKITSIDFAETNPKYDVDGRTARLVASLFWDVCDYLYSK